MGNPLIKKDEIRYEKNEYNFTLSSIDYDALLYN
jgi:hypothetical protein